MFWIFLIFIVLVILSWKQIKNGPKIAKFIYGWGFPLGSFVWEDLLVFSIYGSLAALITFFTHQSKIGILMVLVFWFIRSLGETLYFFLEQFIQPQHYPHHLKNHFQLLYFFFGKISDQQAFIILQVFFQIISMFSLTGLILLVLNWSSF